MKVKLSKTSIKKSSESSFSSSPSYSDVPLLFDTSDCHHPYKENEMSTIHPLPIILNHIQMREKGIYLRRSLPLPVYHRLLRDKEKDDLEQWQEESDRWRVEMRERINEKMEIENDKNVFSKESSDLFSSVKHTTPETFVDKPSSKFYSNKVPLKRTRQGKVVSLPYPIPSSIPPSTIEEIKNLSPDLLCNCLSINDCLHLLDKPKEKENDEQSGDDSGNNEMCVYYCRIIFV
jgi:hypothetical protein